MRNYPAEAAAHLQKRCRQPACIFLSLITLASVLSACGLISPSAPTPLPTVVLGEPGSVPAAMDTPGPLSGSGVVASGVVVPGEQASLSVTLAGRVKDVHIAEGDQVEAGQVILELEGQEALQAAISAAEFELAQAEQAILDLSNAAETARVQSMQAITMYAQQVKDAQYALDNFTIPTDQAEMDAVTALAAMQERLDEARTAFEQVKSRSSGDSTRQQRKEDLDMAQSDYNAAVRRLRLEYDLQVAQIQMAQAQEDYATYSAGPDPDKLRLAEARRTNTQNQLAAAEAALKYLTLTSPFTGTISQVNTHTGEWVLPGQALIVLADVGNPHIETTDLSERDIPQVKPGQAVTVRIKALGQVINGSVVQIAPLAETLGGDVVYKITIELDQIPDGLRPGMTVEVQFP
jgi:multidrug efflux pump subunit AcrA (membrane-fusion protein)